MENPLTSFRKQVAFAVLALTMAGSSTALYAQHDDHQGERQAPHPYVQHKEWKKGYHMKQEDWNRGQRVDYNTYHLSAPPRGYEWREVDGNYVLGAIATGIIASTIIAASH
jgi:Ni/Co efflux regulator RcnB